MKLRVAKKIAAEPDDYTHQQRYHAALRLFRRAATFKDGEAALRALYLRPQRSFVKDDDVDLRFEVFTMQVEKGGRPKYDLGMVAVPASNGKPFYRRDGQAHNFGALPYPNKVLVNGYVSDTSTDWWEQGEYRNHRPYSMKKHMVRSGGRMQGVKPPRQKMGLVKNIVVVMSGSYRDDSPEFS